MFLKFVRPNGERLADGSDVRRDAFIESFREFRVEFRPIENGWIVRLLPCFELPCWPGLQPAIGQTGGLPRDSEKRLGGTVGERDNCLQFSTIRVDDGKFYGKNLLEGDLFFGEFNDGRLACGKRVFREIDERFVQQGDGCL